MDQQGQLDYVAMSNSIISNTVFMAQRLAAAGISQITHEAGLAMSTRFRLGQMGQMRVSEALNNLRQYFGLERVLWFGFGHKSFLALLTEHQAGFNCAALCGSLAEVYGVDRSAQLLQALWRVQGLSEFLEPSRAQFRALVNGCSGFLLVTPFPEVVRRMAGPCTDDDSVLSLAEARSEDWAKAVDAIFQVSKGNLKATSIHGGRDLAFLGAIAHWLFDLRVWVELPDGTTTFSSCHSPEQANVCLHYADMEECDALLKISSTTFVLRSIEELFTDDEYNSMTFRIQWNSCLSELFYDEVDNMLDNIALIGGVLGGIARIYEALRKCEIDVGGLSRTHFINFQPAGYGRGFIDNVCNLFPEIGTSTTFRTTALQILHTDIPTCIEKICNSIRDMTASCCCSNCGVGSDNVIRYHNCHVAVLFFIRTVASIMAHTDIKQSISPSRSGLQRIYSDCRRNWIPGTSRQCSRLLELASGLPHAELTGQDGKTHSNDYLLDSVLQGVARVFVGPAHYKDIDLGPRTRDQSQCTAIVKNGVCLWIDALRNLSADPASMATVHVAPGQIVYKERNYTSIWDLSHASDDLVNTRLTPAYFGEAPTTTLQEEPNQPHNAFRILAQERAESGTIRLVYGLNEERFEGTLQPGIITEEILMATARVPCPQGATCSDETDLPCWQRRSGWKCENLPIQPPHLCRGESYSVGFIWNASSPISKLLAIEGCRTLAWYKDNRYTSSAILIRSDQCMACMTRYITTFRDQASWEHLLYYGGKRRNLLTKEDLLCSLHVI